MNAKTVACRLYGPIGTAAEVWVERKFNHGGPSLPVVDLSEKMHDERMWPRPVVRIARA